MRTLIEEQNIENVLKLYEFTNSIEASFKGKKIISNHFFNIDYGFEDNYQLWESNKSSIFKLFGNKLKIYKELDNSNVCTPVMVDNLLEGFIENHKDSLHVLIKILLDSLRTSEIMNNQLERDIFILDVKLLKGWKVSKCFSYLELNKKRLAIQQDLFSKLLQSLYVKGRLVLSIDPLDFITMSVSKSGWTSCHHPKGGYGTGGIAYMNDSSSIVAYVESLDAMQACVVDPENEEEAHITMPNKIWRQMVTLNDSHDYAMQLKGYPNHSPIYEEMVANWMGELLSREQGHSFKRVQRESHNDSRILQKKNRDLYRILFYCDYSHSNYNNISCIIREDIDSLEGLDSLIVEHKINPIVVGERIYCACGCGEENFTHHAFSEEGCETDYDDEEYNDDIDQELYDNDDNEQNDGYLDLEWGA